MRKLFLTPGFAAAMWCLLVSSVLRAQPQPMAVSPDNVQRNYKLGVGDQLSVKAANADELSDKPFRIDKDGFLVLPMVGKVKAEGMTAEELETDLAGRLAEYVKSPQVTVKVLQTRPEPVFLVGAFKNPGVFSAPGGRTLLEVLTAAGGLAPNASRQIRIVRKKEMGKIPLPNARISAKDGSSSVEITLASLQGSIGPEEDIALMPFDVVSVDRAEPIYVDGEVMRPGTIELGERDSVSLLQVLALSGGLGKDASTNVRILRPVGDSLRRTQLFVDFKKVLGGKINDVAVLPNDVVFVPRNTGKVILTRATAMALGLSMSVIGGLAVTAR